MTHKTRIIAAIIALLALVALGVVYYLMSVPSRASSQEASSERAALAPLPGQIEVADTPEKRVQGLSGRREVADDYGMLFVFDVEGRNGFWMKDMHVPIDIIWIATDGTIVHIEHALSPDTYPEIFTPSLPARYVLETRAGYAQAHGWNHGTRLDLSAYR